MSWAAAAGYANAVKAQQDASWAAAAAYARAVAKPADLNAEAQVSGYLNELGLGSMASKVWQFMRTHDVTDKDRMILWLQDQPEYMQRFPAMPQLRNEGRNITPAEYIGLEKSYAGIMKQYGLPAGFYDKPADFTNLIKQNVSPSELNSRVKDGFARVASAPAAVRDAFSSYFGIKGDTALAAFFLDATKATPMLLEQAQAAEIGGAARQQGLHIGLNMAASLAQRGVTYGEAMTNMAKVAQMAPLMQTGFGETDFGAVHTPDSGIDTPEHAWTPANKALWEKAGGAHVGTADQGTEADNAATALIFQTDPTLVHDAERRLQSRLAQFQGNAHEGNIDKQGNSNLGVAE
jgi:hypothetical protein